MGGVNSIPVVSQAKSGVQLICGDTDGATETQKDFFQQCPVVSQVNFIQFTIYFGFKRNTACTEKYFLQNTMLKTFILIYVNYFSLVFLFHLLIEKRI